MAGRFVAALCLAAAVALATAPVSAVEFRFDPGETDVAPAYAEASAGRPAQVWVAGDFNDWHLGVELHEQAPGIWRCWMRVQRPITYKFIVDGVWKRDPAAAVPTLPDGFGALNSHRPAPGDFADPHQWTDAEVQAALEGVAIREGGELEQAWEFAMAGDYETAIALARTLQDAARPDETRAKGLNGEAHLHRKFGFPDRAVVCWRTVYDELSHIPAYDRAVREWAKHRLLAEGDSVGARALADCAMAGRCRRRMRCQRSALRRLHHRPGSMTLGCLRK